MESQKIVYSHYVLPKEVVIFENGDDIPEDVIVIKQFPIEIFSFHEDIGQVKLDIQAVIEKFLRANAVVNFHTNQGESRATVALVIRKEKGNSTSLTKKRVEKRVAVIERNFKSLVTTDRGLVKSVYEKLMYKIVSFHHDDIWLPGVFLREYEVLVQQLDVK